MSPSDVTTNARQYHPTGRELDQRDKFDNSCILYPVYSTYVPVQIPTIGLTNSFGFGKLVVDDSGIPVGHASKTTNTTYGARKLAENLQLDYQRKQSFGLGFAYELPRMTSIVKPISELHVFHSRVSKDKSSQDPPAVKTNGSNSNLLSTNSESEPRSVSATGVINSLRAGTGFSSELQSALNGDLDLEGMDDLEKEMADDLRNHPTHCLRRGSTMSNFTYLLLDPRITRNLPRRAKSLDDRDVMATFVRSIFYVGKGQGKRSYAHLRTAHAQFYKRRSGFPAEVSETLQHILSIWSSGHGVVSVPLFHNTVAIEAHTREACMIEAIGLSSLTNKRRGVYYGQSRSWTRETKCMMGVYLLKRALQIFLCEGERPIGPRDIS